MSSSRVQTSLTGAPDCLRDPRRLDHEVVECAPAEAAAGAGHVDGDVVSGEAQGARRPAGRPACGPCDGAHISSLPSAEARGAVHRLQRMHGRGRDRCRPPRRPWPRLRARRRRRRPCGATASAAASTVACPAANPCCPAERWVPRSRSPAACRGPSARATSCRPRWPRRLSQPARARCPLDDEGVPHAGHRLDRIEIGARHLAAEHRTLLEHGVEHARQRHVDAEERLAPDDSSASTFLTGVPMIVKSFGSLSVTVFEVGRRQGRGLRRQGAVAELATAGACGRRCPKRWCTPRRHAPRLCRGG